MKILVHVLLFTTLVGSAVAAARTLETEGGRAFLGVILGGDEEQATLQSVVADGPAAQAGLKNGDRVIAIDGKSIATTGDLRGALRSHHSGDQLSFQVEREGAKVTLAVTLGEQNDGKAVAQPAPAKEPAGDGKHPDVSGSGVVALGPARVPQGAAASPATPELSPGSLRGLGAVAASTGGFMGVYLEDGEGGALVTGVVPGSPAQAAGIQAQDVITAIGDHRVQKASDLRTALGSHSAGDQVQVQAKRGDQVVTCMVTLGKAGEAATPAPAPHVAEKTERAPSRQAEPPQGQRPYLGIGIESSDGGTGVKVGSVVDDSPAAKAGLQAGDVITSMDRKDLGDVNDLMAILEQHHAGDSLRLAVKRGDEQLSLRVRLGSRPEESEAEEVPAITEQQEEHAKAKNELKKLAKRGDSGAPGFLGVFCDQGDQGAAVQSVVDGSPAELAGVQAGDVIIAIDGQKVDSHEQLTKAVRSHHAGDTIKIEVSRGGAQQTLKAKLGAVPEAQEEEAGAEPSQGEDEREVHAQEQHRRAQAERAEKAARQQADRAAAQADRAAEQAKRAAEQAKRAAERALQQAERERQRVERAAQAEQQRETQRRARAGQSEKKADAEPQGEVTMQGTAPRAFLGVIPDASFEGEGLRVQDVVEGSPAQNDGLKAGDIIVRMDRRQIRNTQDIFAALGEHEPGDQVGVRVQRGDEAVRLRVTLGERATEAEQHVEQHTQETDKVEVERKHAESKKQARGQATGGAFLGVQLGDDDGGAHIESLVAGSPADQAGLREGDVITRVDGETIGSADDLVTVIASLSPGKSVKLRVQRDGKSQTVSVTLGRRKETQVQSMLELPNGDAQEGEVAITDDGEHTVYDSLRLDDDGHEAKVDDLVVADSDDAIEPEITDVTIGADSDEATEAAASAGDDDSRAVFEMVADDDCDKDDNGRCDETCEGDCGEGCDDDQCDTTCTEDEGDETDCTRSRKCGEEETDEDGQQVLFTLGDDQGTLVLHGTGQLEHPGIVSVREGHQHGQSAGAGCACCSCEHGAEAQVRIGRPLRATPPAPPAPPVPPAPPAGRLRLARPQNVQVTAPSLKLRVPRVNLIAPRGAVRVARAMPATCSDDCTPLGCACTQQTAQPPHAAHPGQVMRRSVPGFAVTPVTPTDTGGADQATIIRLQRQIERLHHAVQELRARLGDQGSSVNFDIDVSPSGDASQDDFGVIEMPVIPDETTDNADGIEIEQAVHEADEQDTDCCDEKPAADGSSGTSIFM